MRCRLPGSDFGSVPMVLLVLTLLITGGRRVRNRTGNVHDGKASVAFLNELFAQLGKTLKRRYVLEMRMDGAFFRNDVIDLLEGEGIEYAIKAPFYPWLGLKEHIVARRRWMRVGECVECFDRTVIVDNIVHVTG